MLLRCQYHSIDSWWQVLEKCQFSRPHCRHFPERGILPIFPFPTPVNTKEDTFAYAVQILIPSYPEGLQ